MNIVYISKYTGLPEYGNPNRHYYLAKYLSKLSNNKVLLIGSQSVLEIVPEFEGLYRSEREDELDKVTLKGPKIELGFNLKRIWSWIIFEWNIFRYRKKIRKFEPDILVVSSLSILTFLSGSYLKHWLKIPLVIEIRDIHPLTLLEVGNFSSWNPAILFLKWVEKTGYKNANLIVSTLPNAKEHISTVLKKPFDFFWLPMGIATELYVNSEKLVPKYHFEKEDGNFIVAYAGTVGRANALETLFDAVAVLQYSHKHIKFVIIGEGPQKLYYQEKFKHFKNLSFYPAVPKNEVPGILEQADLLINLWLNRPIYNFGISPNKWMDYMYSGKPILVAYSGYKCIIEEAGCGKFIPAEDKEELIKAIVAFSETEKEKLKEMGEKGKKYLLEKLDYKNHAKKLYEKLLAINRYEIKN